MKIVIPVDGERSEIRDIPVGAALAGIGITEVRLDVADFVRLARLPESEFRNWFQGLYCRFYPAGEYRDTPERRPHTAEPWREGRKGSVVAGTPVPEMGGSDAVYYYGGHLVAESITPANARRIVACVNACKGLDTGWLEDIFSKGRTINDEAREWREAHHRYHEPATCNNGHKSLPLKLWDCPTCSEIRREERARLIEALRPFANWANYGVGRSGYPEWVLLNDDEHPVRGKHFHVALNTLIDLGEWPGPQTPAEGFNDPVLRAQVEALAHEPSRDELNDMHEPDPEGEPWRLGANSATAMDDLRATASDEHSGARCSQCGGAGGEHWDTGCQSEPEAVDDAVDNLGLESVQLCQRLAYALSELKDIRKAVDADPEESTLDAVQRAVEQRVSVKTERRHVNGKPFYTAEEVAQYAREQELARNPMACGFPGGLGKP